MARRAQAAATPELTHIDSAGRLRMVDVGDKPITAREAVARGAITVSAAVQRLVRSGQVRKGNPIEAARLAGIMAAKRTSEIIPLCHPIALTHVGLEIAPTRTGYRITATARTTAQTGVEMEALTAVSAAALTLYDMLKAADRGMVIGDICLVEKTGGRSGPYRRPRSGRPRRT
jgi:cyclic pyranopterin monophosphate synthase